MSTRTPTDVAATHVLLVIASRGDRLLQVLQELGLLDVPHPRSRHGMAFPALAPLPVHEAGNLGERLRRMVDDAELDEIERKTGVPRARFLAAAVEQLRVVAVFAQSDGGATSENVRAVESLVRSGGAEMFAPA